MNKNKRAMFGKNEDDFEIKKEDIFDDFDEFDEERYEFMRRKSVQDWDGFLTDYTMWFDHNENKYIFIFGDSEIYDPSNTEPDWECDGYDEAVEWFNSYTTDDEDDFDDDFDYEAELDSYRDFVDFDEDFKL